MQFFQHSVPASNHSHYHIQQESDDFHIMSESEDSAVDSARREHRGPDVRLRFDSTCDSGTDTMNKEREMLQVRGGIYFIFNFSFLSCLCIYLFICFLLTVLFIFFLVIFPCFFLSSFSASSHLPHLYLPLYPLCHSLLCLCHSKSFIVM